MVTCCIYILNDLYERLRIEPRPLQCFSRDDLLHDLRHKPDPETYFTTKCSAQVAMCDFNVLYALERRKFILHRL